MNKLLKEAEDFRVIAKNHAVAFGCEWIATANKLKPLSDPKLGKKALDKNFLCCIYGDMIRYEESPIYLPPVLSKSKGGNHLITFTSNINVETTYSITSKGDQESTMELFVNEDSIDPKRPHRNGKGVIEWNVDALETGEQIGIWWERGELVEYDGVMSLPKEVGVLLKAFGVRVPKDMY